MALIVVAFSFLFFSDIISICPRNISNGYVNGECNVSINILSVNEKLPVSKFRYFGKYIIQLFGYFYVHVSGQ